MKHILTLICVILLSCFGTSCIKKLKEAAEDIVEPTSTSESLSESNFSLIDIDNDYQVLIPKYMKPMPNLNDEASLQYANIFKEIYTIVINENKQEFIETFKSLGEYNDSLPPIENYKNVQKQMLDEAIANVKFRDYGLTEINTYPARQFKMEGEIDGLDFFYLVGFIEGDENIYMLMNWTLKDRKSRYENIFEYINGSFKLL